MTNDSNFGEKAGFIVALFAAFIALNFYSDFFEKMILPALKCRVS